uniref:Uncharacterized protein n=1 Tax=Craspedostauros australis TaxID=1486917 RepID=A0A7R9ZQE8_9STRA
MIGSVMKNGICICVWMRGGQCMQTPATREFSRVIVAGSDSLNLHYFRNPWHLPSVCVGDVPEMFRPLVARLSWASSHCDDGTSVLHSWTFRMAFVLLTLLLLLLLLMTIVSALVLLVSLSAVASDLVVDDSTTSASTCVGDCNRNCACNLDGLLVASRNVAVELQLEA